LDSAIQTKNQKSDGKRITPKFSIECTSSCRIAKIWHEWKGWNKSSSNKLNKTKQNKTKQNKTQKGLCSRVSKKKAPREASDCYLLQSLKTVTKVVMRQMDHSLTKENLLEGQAFALHSQVQ